MALRLFKNKETGKLVRSFKVLDPTQFEEVLVAPAETKCMVKVDGESGKSKLKDMEAQLKARSRNHSRDNNLQDYLELSKESGMGENRALLNDKGLPRRKIDDI